MNVTLVSLDVGVLPNVICKCFMFPKFLRCYVNSLYQFLSNSKSDLTTCSEKSATFTCKENWNFEECGQMNDAKYKNYACKQSEAEESEFFDCTNRMDKVNVLFAQPPLATRKSRKSRNYNVLLNFDNTTIYCGSHNFTFEEFENAYHEYGTAVCGLKEGKKVSIEDLWLDLLNDYSFMNSFKMFELYQDNRTEQLSAQCHQEVKPFRCGSNSNQCINPG